MPATLDLSAVRSFTDDLKERLRRCDNGEGMMCSNLEKTIDHYAQSCGQLRQFVHEWARAVFTGSDAFDSASEELLKAGLQHLLHRAKQVAACGRAMTGQCFILQGLDGLHAALADLDYLLENWVSPRLAVGPAPRVAPSEAANRQIVDRLKQLPPLPHDWQPSDPKQLAAFQERTEG